MTEPDFGARLWLELDAALRAAEDAEGVTDLGQWLVGWLIGALRETQGPTIANELHARFDHQHKALRR